MSEIARKAFQCAPDKVLRSCKPHEVISVVRTQYVSGKKPRLYNLFSIRIPRNHTLPDDAFMVSLEELRTSPNKHIRAVCYHSQTLLVTDGQCDWLIEPGPDAKDDVGH